MRRLPILCALSLAAASTAALAQSGHRQLGAHEHGAGTLNIAVEGSRVSMELEVPGADIVGFEHAATTDEQKAQLAAAKEKLNNGLSLFRLPNAAGCRLIESEVDYATEDHGAVHSEDEAGESAADHRHDHDHGHHDGDSHATDDHGTQHDHDHDHDHAAAEHAEFRVAYSIECEAPSTLGEIAFDYFGIFENAERLEVNVVTDKGQTSLEATRAEPVVSLESLM